MQITIDVNEVIYVTLNKEDKYYYSLTEDEPNRIVIEKCYDDTNKKSIRIGVYGRKDNTSLYQSMDDEELEEWIRSIDLQLIFSPEQY